MRVVAAGPADYGWLCNKLGYTPTNDFRAIKAVTEWGGIEGMVGYDNFTPNMWEIHFYTVTTRAAAALVRPTFFYPFMENRPKILLGRVPSSDILVRRFVHRLGFQEVHKIRGGWHEDVDIILVEMRRENCKWIRKVTHGQERRTAS